LSRCEHVEEVRVGEACYWCVKVSANLIGDHSPNGAGKPTPEQLRYVGVINPDLPRGAVFDDWWDLSPIEAWERMVEPEETRGRRPV
jgi:hypothetical protein